MDHPALSLPDEWGTGGHPEIHVGPNAHFTLRLNQAPSTKGWSKQYTCSCEWLNTLEKGSWFHPAFSERA